MAQLETIPCPLCGETDGHLAVDVPGGDGNIRGYGAIYAGLAKSSWKICGRCGFVHQNPRPSAATLDAYYLAGQYHPHTDPPDPEALVRRDEPAYRDEIDFALEHSGVRTGTVFDIGCGYGAALECWRRRGFEPFGVEPDRFLYEFARDRYGHTGVQHGVLDGAIDLAGTIDIAFSHHAIEHVADLHAMMAGIVKILRPGGYLFTALPTYFKNRTTMSKLWMNSAHYSMFTVRTFDQLLARYGFAQVAHRYERWTSTPDQFGHLARFTGTPFEPSQFYEDPHAVARYLRVVNPLRSLAYYPLHGGYRAHIAQAATLARRAAGVLRSDPLSLPRRARDYVAWRRSLRS
ncbi:MAG: class I SAM-dependent methyltransferase [Kofleriaceae bacterium]